MNKNAVIFSGQGSQYIGMCKSICNEYPISKQTFEEASDILKFNLLKLCTEGSISELSKTENTQPAILTASIAMYRACINESMINPTFLAGHSLGEISALTCSGALRFQDAVKLVRERGRLMQLAPGENGSMVAIRDLDRVQVEGVCNKINRKDGIVVVSNYNNNKEYVISGHTNSVKLVAEELENMGARTNVLKVSGAFHSPLMKEASDEFRKELEKYKFSKMNIPVISNATALPYKNSEEILDLLPLQIISPVYWNNSIEYIINQGVDTFIEAGPNIILKKITSKILPCIKVFSLDDKDDVCYINEKVIKSSKEKQLDDDEILLIIKRCVACAVSTPNYNWDNNQYNEGAVKPYRGVKKRFLEIIDGVEKEANINDVRKSLAMLKSVLSTKCIPEDDKVRKIEHIFKGIKSKDILNLK